MHIYSLSWILFIDAAESRVGILPAITYFAGTVVKTGFYQFLPKSGKIFQNPKSFPIIVAFI